MCKIDSAVCCGDLQPGINWNWVGCDWGLDPWFVIEQRISRGFHVREHFILKVLSV